jgi:hypothetical protein
MTNMTEIATSSDENCDIWELEEGSSEEEDESGAED